VQHVRTSISFELLSSLPQLSRLVPKLACCWQCAQLQRSISFAVLECC
jgi:hypothetical protein